MEYKGKKILNRTFIALSAVALLVTGLVGYGLFRETPQVSNTAPLGGSVVADAIRVPPVGYKEYRNEHYKFSFFYPEDARVREVDEGGGAMTVIYEDLENERGFQVYIIPYAERMIHQERFLTDVPSGVRNNERTIQLDGVEAVVFDSMNEILGETKEVWAIQNGYLFEITTFKHLEAWLGEALYTWRFL